MPSHRLGLLGGTFDPPHVGHLVVAQDAVERLSLHRLLFVVAGDPPHKARESLSPAPVRLEMVRAAVAGNPRLGVSAVEMERSGPTYTVDTVRLFRQDYPEALLFFLMGADQLAEFHEWREPEVIASMATVVAMAREGVAAETWPTAGMPHGLKVDVVHLHVTRLDISSTDVRERVREGRSIQYLVPLEVQSIIEGHGLYRSNS